MNNLLVILLFCLAISPGLYGFFKARRRRILAEQECRISAAITELEQMLCDAVLIKGDLCHDRVYQSMRQIQSCQHYHLKGVLRSPKPGQLAFIRQFRRELDSHEPRLRHSMETFASAYLQAARVKHPLRFYPAILCLLVFKCGRPTLRHLRNLGNTCKTVKQNLQREYVARSMSELHA